MAGAFTFTNWQNSNETEVYQVAMFSIGLIAWLCWLWRRDRVCTYPGCTAPAAWSKAHHVIHWADGGLSDVDNAALLCQRHHTMCTPGG